MLSEEKIIRLILGFKVRHLRQQKGLSYQELSTTTKLSTSYLNDIEKGKRYPKPDKISQLAQALGVDYNYLVATNASKKLQPIIDLLTSKFFKLFPLDEFGISLEKLLELFTQTPDKVNAFISTIFKIARNYQVDESQFYLEALRSYQDMHNNYFPELEAASRDFKQEFSIRGTLPYTVAFLEDQLLELYGIRVDRDQLPQQKQLAGIRSFFHHEKKILFLQHGLAEAQENFLLARELGFQYLQLGERPYETTILQIDSFEQLLNNYKASHFAAALLMDEEELARDLRQIARNNTWHAKLLLDLLRKYQVTAEMLLQRLTNILPHHFGLEDLFFIRLTGSEDLKSFTMTKDLHLSQLHSPYNNELDEHYCNRWVSISSIKDLRLPQKGLHGPDLIADAQISRYWNSDKEYLCLSLAKPAFGRPKRGVSVTLGLLVDPKLRSIFYFLSDPQLKVRQVHTTCERCGVPDCEVRVASPKVIEQMEKRDQVFHALADL
ncbi:MAG: helix-turn-helix domain-containing protein [Bacteroidota bacterium]